MNTQNKIKIISYNIHSGKNILMIPQFKKVIAFLKEEKPDIIGIQEINENNRRGKQITAMKTQLKINCHFGANIKLGDGNYGIASLTPHPIKNKKHRLLPSIKEQRSFLDTKLCINNTDIHLINTHLSLSTIERERQLNMLREYLANLTSPIILLGDFNTVETGLEDLLIDTAKIAKKEHLPTLMLNNKRIDYIYTSKHFRVLSYNVISVKMSDHYPIVCEVMFNYN